MYIAGSYMLYSPSMEKHSNGFRVDDILGTAAREMAPRKAACVVLRSALHDAPSIPSKDLKFGIDKILSDAISTRKDAESESPMPSSPSPICSLSCSACISRCCPMPSCRCNHIIEPYPVYPYQPTAYPKFSAQPLMSYSNSIYSSSELDMRLGTMSSVAHHAHHTANGKRKRSWSRAVFSNLQRKGLEKRFQIQKYITKPDRRQLAATLGLTDAQVKVWFQNRRMKWRHSKEAREQFKTDKKVEDSTPEQTTPTTTTTTTTENSKQTVTTTM